MYDGPIIDCDVHHTWATNEELLGYMTPRWREFARDTGFAVRPASAYPHTGGLNKRLDSFGPEGEPPGSSAEVLAEQLLDPLGVTRAILSYDIGHEAAQPNPYLGANIARAANDWSIDRWLSGTDERLYGAVMVANQDPIAAAAEIRRVGGHPRMAEVLLVAAGLGMPLGHPVYHPIYEAAEEVGLPVAIHVGAESLPQAMSAAGPAMTRFEYHALAGQPVIHHLSSAVTHGIFERFPRLRLLLVEIGLSWLPWALHTLDVRYGELRRESPWVRALPSEYVRRHVVVTTQPFELTQRPGRLGELLATVDGVEELLCFASDYPHWDADELRFVDTRLPRGWPEKVFHDNAARAFGWDRVLARPVA